ncbi:MAG: hemerythrin family protein [Burkholderiales bacterium]|nr:hemerythrin family protein [Burkholderiales bacterium]
MSWASWSEKYATGHAGMDQGHRRLMELINQLADAMESNKPMSFCSDLLERFIEHTRMHFLAEEQLMDRIRYPKAKEHKALHEMLVTDVLAFKASYDSGTTAQFVTLLVILDCWLERDISAADKELADFVAVPH